MERWNRPVSKSLPGIKKLLQQTFPNYKGRKVTIDNYIPRKLSSYWDGGSRDYFAFYNIATQEVFQIHSNHPFYESNQPSEVPELPINVVIVEHSIFCGKDVGIRIHINLPEEQIPKMLQE